MVTNKGIIYPLKQKTLYKLAVHWRSAVYAVILFGKTQNVAQIKQFCTEEWLKIPPQRRRRLISCYWKNLTEVVAAKGDIKGANIYGTVPPDTL